MFNNLGGTSLTWILVLMLIIGDGENGCGGMTCDTLIWLLLLSKFCGGDEGGGCGCGCGSTPTRCGCN